MSTIPTETSSVAYQPLLCPDEQQRCTSEKDSIWKRCWTLLLNGWTFFLNVISNITLEPGVFLLYLAGDMGYASWNQMLIIKACHDLGHNSTTCENLLEDQNRKIHKEVTDEVCFYFSFKYGLKLL